MAYVMAVTMPMLLAGIKTEACDKGTLIYEDQSLHRL